MNGRALVFVSSDERRRTWTAERGKRHERRFTGIPRQSGSGAAAEEPDLPRRPGLLRGRMRHAVVHVQQVPPVLAARTRPSLLRAGTAQARGSLTPPPGASPAPLRLADEGALPGPPGEGSCVPGGLRPMVDPVLGPRAVSRAPPTRPILGETAPPSGTEPT